MLSVLSFGFSQPLTDFSKPQLLPNVVSFGAGVGGLYFPSTLYYERILKRNMCDKKVALFIKTGVGSALYWEGASQYALLQIGFMTGVRKRHLEVSIGPT